MHSRGGLWQLKVRKNFIEWKWYCFYINLIEIIFDFSVILYTCYAVICIHARVTPHHVWLYLNQHKFIFYTAPMRKWCVISSGWKSFIIFYFYFDLWSGERANVCHAEEFADVLNMRLYVSQDQEAASSIRAEIRIADQWGVPIFT